MNSTGALSRSVLMDNVTKDERGKWSALESVNMFSWSGSAALGGLLVDLVGILPLFAIMASLQFVGTGPLICLFPHDPVEQESIVTPTCEQLRHQRNRSISVASSLGSSNHGIGYNHCESEAADLVSIWNQAST